MAGVENPIPIQETDPFPIQERGNRREQFWRGMRHLFARDFRSPPMYEHERFLYLEAIQKSNGEPKEVVRFGTEGRKVVIFYRPHSQSDATKPTRVMHYLRQGIR